MIYLVGNGYDIHKLVKKRKFILGNILIPFEKGFLAHSDGDVLIHSIIDAILGACGLGDIGTLFPDNDDKYKGIDSSILLKEVVKKITELGYKIINIDNTIICEKPKLVQYKDAIKKRLSEIIGIEPSRIGIKAKTKEKVDSVGKGKAVEVFSTVLICYENNL